MALKNRSYGQIRGMVRGDRIVYEKGKNPSEWQLSIRAVSSSTSTSKMEWTDGTLEKKILEKRSNLLHHAQSLCDIAGLKGNLYIIRRDVHGAIFEILG